VIGMYRRKAKQGEYIINLETGDVKMARFVFDNGAAVVDEWMPLFSDSPEIEEWTVDDYLVIGEEVDPLLLK
jgi:hypothetical protein